MAIPTYQEAMLPVLQSLAEHGVMRSHDLGMAVADRCKLTEEEKEMLLPSGRQRTVVNRVGWSCWYLIQADLVRRAKPGHFEITEEGRALLAEKPASVDLKLLARYPKFVERLSKSKPIGGGGSSQVTSPDPNGGSITPHEKIEAAFAELKQTLTANLREQLAKVDPFRFEQVVLDLLVAMGYGGSRKEAAQVTQRSGDEGNDGVINEDRLGLDVIYVQAKRWKGNVGRPEIQNFVGALAGKKANKGVFITTGDFHSNAWEYASGLHQKVILIDGQRLAELMIDHNIGVAEEQVYRLKRIDSDYFQDDAI
ncbi:MAG: restriction endonuclease [Chthoniobacteraceae bacterium]